MKAGKVLRAGLASLPRQDSEHDTQRERRRRQHHHDSSHEPLLLCRTSKARPPHQSTSSLEITEGGAKPRLGVRA